jgi:hypothetical protein
MQCNTHLYRRIFSMADRFYSSNYEQWITYLSSLDPPIDASPSFLTFSPIQTSYEQFLTSFPFSIFYWMKYLQLAHHHHQSSEFIFNISSRATLSAPYSPTLWYGRLSHLLNSKPTPASSSAQLLIDISIEATQYLSGHPDAFDFWRLLFYHLPLHGTLTQILYCYWRCLSQPSPYFSLICDLFREFQCKTNFQISDDSQSVSIETIPSPASHEVPLIALYFSAISRYEQNNEVRMKEYLQSQQMKFEQQITRKYYESGMVSSSELSNWHEYLSFEELLCESPGNDHLPYSHAGGQPIGRPSSSSSSSPECECLVREMEYLAICCPKLATENSQTQERVEEKRKYDRVVQLYERCLLVCSSYSGERPFSLPLTMSSLNLLSVEIWKRYISWTMRLAQRSQENKKYLQRALRICHRAISTTLREWSTRLLASLTFPNSSSFSSSP